LYFQRKPLYKGNTEEFFYYFSEGKMGIFKEKEKKDLLFALAFI